MFEIKKKECDNVKKLLKLTGAVAGVAAVAGTTAYVLTQTEKGRELAARTKKKMTEFKELLQEQLGADSTILEEASLTDPALIVYDYEDELVGEEGLHSLPTTAIDPLVPQSESKTRTTRSRLICNRRQAVYALYEQGLDVEAIADALNLSFDLVLNDLTEGQKNGRLDY